MENKNNLTQATNFIDPDAILKQLDIPDDSIVADFGCGSGYFSMPVAQIVENGKVHSLDVLPSALESVESKAKISGISNVITKRVNLENEKGSKLEDNSMDWVIVKDMLFQNKNKNGILQEAHRVLKENGKVLVVEWSAKDYSFGPEKALKVSSEDLEKIQFFLQFHYSLHSQ